MSEIPNVCAIDCSNQCGVRDRCEIYEEHTIGEIFHQFGGDLQRQAGFADASRTKQRKQRDVLAQ